MMILQDFGRTKASVFHSHRFQDNVRERTFKRALLLARTIPTFLKVTIQQQIVFVPEDVTFLMCPVHHITVYEALINLVLALSHFTYRLAIGLFVDYVMQLIIKACLATV